MPTTYFQFGFLRFIFFVVVDAESICIIRFEILGSDDFSISDRSITAISRIDLQIDGATKMHIADIYNKLWLSQIQITLNPAASIDFPIGGLVSQVCSLVFWQIRTWGNKVEFILEILWWISLFNSWFLLPLPPLTLSLFLLGKRSCQSRYENRQKWFVFVFVLLLTPPEYQIPNSAYQITKYSSAYRWWQCHMQTKQM